MDSICTVEQAACMTFEPMDLDNGIVSQAAFREKMSELYTTLSVGMRLLNMNAEQMAMLLFEVFPDDPTELIETINDSKAWLEGLAEVLGCVESRMLVALSKRVEQA